MVQKQSSDVFIWYVRDILRPKHDYAKSLQAHHSRRFPDRQMNHVVVGRGAIPVLDAGCDIDGSTWLQDLLVDGSRYTGLMSLIGWTARLKPIARRAAIVLLFVALSSIGLSVKLLREHYIAHQTNRQSAPKSTTYRGLVIPVAGATLLPTLSGHGQQRTGLFNPTGDWNVYWTFSGLPAPGADTFSITAYTAAGQPVTDGQPLKLINQESGYGTLHYHGSGQHYLVVNAPTAFSWSITVKAAPPAAADR